MRVVEAAGDPRTLGRVTGEQLREEVRTNLDHFLGRWDETTWERRREAFTACLERHVPEVMAELQGLAEGADLDLDIVLRLNCPAYAGELDLEGCTNVVFGAGPDGPVLGKNNDGMAPGSGRAVCLRVIRPTGGIPCAFFTYAGMLATTDGLNAEGLAIGHSSVGSIYQQSDHHVPVRLWAHHWLQRSRTTEEFVRNMAGKPTRGKGYSAVVVDRSGSACSLEIACPLFQVRRPSLAGGNIHCVNCYQSPQLAESDRRNEAGKDFALKRWRFLDDYLAGDRDFSLQDMKALLRGHESVPMCRHGKHDGNHTEYSIIGLPREGRLLHCEGRPCESEYAEIRI